MTKLSARIKELEKDHNYIFLMSSLGAGGVAVLIMFIALSPYYSKVYESCHNETESYSRFKIVGSIPEITKYAEKLEQGNFKCIYESNDSYICEAYFTKEVCEVKRRK